MSSKSKALSRPPLHSNSIHNHSTQNAPSSDSKSSTFKANPKPNPSSSRQRQQQQQHLPLPNPSTINKPATTSSYFYHTNGGLGHKHNIVQSQNIFAQSIQQRNPSINVLFPGMDQFEYERIDVWNHDNICTPCLIVQPKSNREVCDVVQAYIAGVKLCLVENKKMQHHHPNWNSNSSTPHNKLTIPRLSIASGRNSIHAMQDGCIVLDMSRMRQIKVNNTSSTCKVQGGVRVIDLDATLSEYNLIAISSIFQNMGVVGSILSGGCGFGYASRKYGLACDNLLEAEVVLADGRLKTCSKTKNEDLFYTLCGGGCGVGVVVSVTLKCYPLVHAALLTYDIPCFYKDTDRLGGSKDKALVYGKKTVLKYWAKWIHGEVVNIDDGEGQGGTGSGEQHRQARLPLLRNNTNKKHINNNNEDYDAASISSMSIASSKSSSSSSKSSSKGKSVNNNNNNNKENTNQLQEDEGVDNDIYSQLIIPTKQSSPIQFLATSINEKAIPQRNGFLEQYEQAERKASGGVGPRISLIPRWITSSNNITTNNNNSSKQRTEETSFKQYKTKSSQMQPYGWDKTPGLSNLIHDKFGAPSRNRVKFRMVRYADQLQSHSNEYFTSGNIYIATKYAMALTSQIVDVLVQATTTKLSSTRKNDICPNNESKIYIHALGGETGNVKDLHSMAYNARHMKYVIFIEGRWDGSVERKLVKEKQKVIAWVNWVVNKLNKSEGIQSTSHPETQRDQVRSGKEPPKGWYNFDEKSGKRLLAIKQKRDPKNVFSLASQIKWSPGITFYDESNNDIALVGEKYTSTEKIKRLDAAQVSLENLNIDELSDHVPDTFYDDDDEDEDEDDVGKESNERDLSNSNIGDDQSLGSDLKRLFAITDDHSEDEKDCKFNESTLGRADFDDVIDNDEKKDGESNVSF